MLLSSSGVQVRQLPTNNQIKLILSGKKLLRTPGWSSVRSRWIQLKRGTPMISAVLMQVLGGRVIEADQWTAIGLLKLIHFICTFYINFMYTRGRWRTNVQYIYIYNHLSRWNFGSDFSLALCIYVHCDHRCNFFKCQRSGNIISDVEYINRCT